MALWPVWQITLRLITRGPGPDPGDWLVESLGIAALQLLCVTLAIRPVRQMTGWSRLVRFRRMLGLFALFYASLHLLAYCHLIAGWSSLWAETVKRPFISVGFLAFLILVVLGLTSFRAAMRRLGQNWKRLHRSVYLAALLGWAHFLWQVRSDWMEPLLYGVLLLFLLAWRLPWKKHSNRLFGGRNKQKA